MADQTAAAVWQRLRRGLLGPCIGCDNRVGAGRDRRAMAAALQRAAFLAGLRLLPGARDAGGRHGRVISAVPDTGGQLLGGRPRAFDGRWPAHRLGEHIVASLAHAREQFIRSVGGCQTSSTRWNNRLVAGSGGREPAARRRGGLTRRA